MCCSDDRPVEQCNDALVRGWMYGWMCGWMGEVVDGLQPSLPVVVAFC